MGCNPWSYILVENNGRTVMDHSAVGKANLSDVENSV